MLGFADVAGYDISEVVRQRPRVMIQNYEENVIRGCGEDCKPFEFSSDLCWKLININPGTHCELVLRPSKGGLILLHF